MLVALFTALAVLEYTKHVPIWALFWAVLAAMCLFGSLRGFIIELIHGPAPVSRECACDCDCDCSCSCT